MHKPSNGLWLVVQLICIIAIPLCWLSAYALSVVPWVGSEHGGLQYEIVLWIAMTSPLWAGAGAKYILLSKDDRADSHPDVSTPFVGFVVFGMCLIAFLANDGKLNLGRLAEQAHYESATFFESERPHPDYVAQNPESLQEFESSLAYLKALDRYETVRYEAYGRLYRKHRDRIASEQERYVFFVVLLITGLNLVGVIPLVPPEPSSKDP